MDVNEAFPGLKESTASSVATTRALAEQWHNSYDGRIKYAVAPRFILSCIYALMKEAFEIAAHVDGILFHTHASENKHELEAVHERCKLENIAYITQLDQYSMKSCLV